MIRELTAFDIETTGLKPSKDKIIEIGAVKVKDGKITDEFSELINPEISIPTKITSLTGISDTMTENADTAENVIRRFIQFLGEDIILGHNVLFDYSFIKAFLQAQKIGFERQGIDTLGIARKCHPELKSRSLENMCRYYKIQNKNAHRALDDAKAAFELFRKLSEGFEQERPQDFLPVLLNIKIKKEQPVTLRQKNYLIDLIKYHKIDFTQSVESLTKSEASRLIDKIIVQYGKIH